MESDNSHAEMRQLIQQNSELIKENNRLLKKLYRNEIIGIWVKVIWFILLIGLPFALYFYILEPYFTAVGSSYETFSLGMQEIPLLKQLEEIISLLKEGK